MAMTLITTNTESNAASSSFTSGIDSTYKLYIFKFIDVGPATDNADFSFQCNAASGSGYNETITSTVFYQHANEADVEAENLFLYHASADQQQGTSTEMIGRSRGNGADESTGGELWLYNPSSTTYVKHFQVRTQGKRTNDFSWENICAGYINTTSAIDEVQFKMTTGNMDAIIKMYGVG